MSSLLHNLENNEAILLMYLADELPSQDRAEVEQMLAGDAGLRAALERLQGVHETIQAELALLDRAEPLPLTESVAVRRVGREMAQWHAGRVARRAVEPAPTKGKPYPWWAYSISSAAVVLLGLLVWWGFFGETHSTLPPVNNVAQNNRTDPRWNYPGGPSRSGDWAPGQRLSGMAATTFPWMFGTPGGGGAAGDRDELEELEEELLALSDDGSSSMFYGAAMSDGADMRGDAVPH